MFVKLNNNTTFLIDILLHVVLIYLKQEDNFPIALAISPDLDIGNLFKQVSGKNCKRFNMIIFPAATGSKSLDDSCIAFDSDGNDCHRIHRHLERIK